MIDGHVRTDLRSNSRIDEHVRTNLRFDSVIAGHVSTDPWSKPRREAWGPSACEDAIRRLKQIMSDCFAYDN